MSKLERLRLIVLDVDGVLTDGTFLLGAADEELKAFHARDGVGLALWRDAGHDVTFLTGRGGEAVRRRAKELRLARIWERRLDKGTAFGEILRHYGVAADEVAAMGDDLTDLPMLAAAGLSACPADAVEDVRRRVDLVVPSAGGRGAVRDLIEHILRGRGEWESLLERLL